MLNVCSDGADAAHEAVTAWLLRKSGATRRKLRLTGEGMMGRLTAMLARSVVEPGAAAEDEWGEPSNAALMLRALKPRGVSAD
eukprot:gene41291-4499_t